MIDDNPFEQHLSPRLTVAQQDRAAGLLVGMAVGEWMMWPSKDERSLRQYSDEVTDRALTAVEQDEPAPLEWRESIDSWATDLLRIFSYVGGTVLPDLHLPPDAVFKGAYNCAEGDAEEIGYSLGRKGLTNACGLWAVILQHAVLTGEADLRLGTPFLNRTYSDLDPTSQIRAMAQGVPSVLRGGGPFDMLQSTWTAVSGVNTVKKSHRFTTGMKAAVPVEDRWIVGPLVGATLGAVCGYSAIPWAWRRSLRDARGSSMDKLMRSAVSSALELDHDSDLWPNIERMTSGSAASSTSIAHPSDPNVRLGGLGALDTASVDAVVSVCRTGSHQRPSGIPREDHATFWLVDSADPQDNPNLDYVLEDAARAIFTFRKEGKTVLLHGLTGESRTPTVAAHYGSLISGRSVWEEFQRIVHALPQAAPNSRFLRHLASVDTRPRDVTEELAFEQPPLGHHTVDRQLIELLSWSVVANLLESVAGEGWIQPVDGVEDRLAVVLREGPRVEFLRMGAGITVDDELVMSWSKAVTLGTPQKIMACLRSAAGLDPELQMITSAAVSTWKPLFAASLVRNGYSRARSIRIQPLEDKPDQLLNYHYSGGPDLLCEVDEFAFIVTRESISTDASTLWEQSSGDGDADTAARAVLDRLFSDRNE